MTPIGGGIFVYWSRCGGIGSEKAIVDAVLVQPGATPVTPHGNNGLYGLI